MINDRDTFFLESPPPPPLPPAPTKRRRRPWQFRLSTILVLMVLFGGLFVWLRDYVHNQPIAWVPYSAESLNRERSEGHVVLLFVDADWDLSTAANRKFALETRKVRSFLREQGIVPMKADWTESSPQIDAVLNSLQTKSTPIMAIYPAAKSAEPMVLHDVVTERQVLAALQEAIGKRP
jgi:thiol:disulfide interchange protein DsbD